MSKKTKLHPSVQQFKQFVKKHPLLIKEVRDGNKTWQDIYEEWTILGEKDEVWEKYKKNNHDASEEVAADIETEEENEPSKSQGGDLLSLLKNINLNDIQGHIQNLSGMMASVQSLLQSFQSNSNNNNQQSQEGNQGQQGQQNQQNQQNPFNFRQF
ncbi:hypothetical protein BKP35_14930 [Anaerobacillus arseniciselenatis]|uniref:Cytosolic protein n=1 Tax=Anaerobacillus arseniciselenatis TaxID=85682 RepID=A0A1S2LB99_9BACI|nr:YlbD family protein [Anaerobacillus arseniciselenatis]OIJ09778.1 hypothetical protein BKP35_14930 [Anaerobacillus arseniciselenatis]